MKRANITLTCLLFLIASFNIHSQEKIHVDQTTTSTIRLTSAKDRLVVATTTRRFTIKELYDAFDAPHDLYLLKEEFRSERQIGTEGQKGTVTVDAWLLPDEKTKVWSISQNGDEGRIWDDFYLVTKYGCCAALSTKVFFDLKKGRKLFSTTAEHVTVVVPNTSVSLTRYIAFHSIEASLPPLDDKQVPDLSGVIQYVSNSNVLQRIAVISKNQNAASITLRYQGKQNEGRTLMLWGFDKKNSISSLSDFSIVVSYGSAGEIVLPVRDDKIDLKNATYPKFFQLKSIQE